MTITVSAGHQDDPLKLVGTSFDDPHVADPITSVAGIADVPCSLSLQEIGLRYGWDDAGSGKKCRKDDPHITLRDHQSALKTKTYCDRGQGHGVKLMHASSKVAVGTSCMR